ncbi:MAG: hypothetical protein ACLQSR_10840 [Limisphaerales bacterium]
MIMKIFSCYLNIIILLISSGLCQAQSTNSQGNQSSVPAPTPYSIVSSDANSRVWERTVYEQGTNGETVATKHRYTEISSGLNHLVNGQYVASKEEIDIQPDGTAAATNGQHQVYFPANIYNGTIAMMTPDGLQLQSRPVGLYYEDNSNSVLIATLTKSVGELAGSNEVVYPNAFEGAAASLRYTYTKAGFEQDVVVQGQLPDPATLGLNPARTRLGVLTAFFDTNNPVATPGPTDPTNGLSDTTLQFGVMTMGRGRAFSIGNAGQIPPPAVVTPASWLNWITNAAQQSSSSSPTFKRWFQLNGRNFLTEEVPYQRVAAQLKQLPPTTARLNAGSTNLLAWNSFLNTIPARLLSRPAPGTTTKTQAMRLSRVDLDQTRALVLDYETVNSSGNYTFQGDTTYYVSGRVIWTPSRLKGGP